MRLIRKYSKATIPRDKVPRILARSQAAISGKIETDNGILAEWTAPSTPLFLGFDDMPVRGQTVSKDDFQFIGSIGDIRLWVDRSRADLRFVVQDISLAMFSLALGVLMWTKEFPAKRRAFAQWFARRIWGGRSDV